MKEQAFCLFALLKQDRECGRLLALLPPAKQDVVRQLLAADSERPEIDLRSKLRQLRDAEIIASEQDLILKAGPGFGDLTPRFLRLLNELSLDHGTQDF